MISIRIAAPILALAGAGLVGCADMTYRERTAATGAVVGGVVGNVASDGSALGTAAGAVAGGVIGHAYGDRREQRRYGDRDRHHAPYDDRDYHR